MDQKRFGVVSLLLFAAIARLQAQHQDVHNSTDTLRITLADAWTKAEAFSRAIRIKETEVGIRRAELSDAITERLPELGVSGSAEKASNIPIYDNGLFSEPSQHEVIHTLYRVGADLRLNIYDGNKLNLKIREERTRLQIAGIRNDEMLSEIRYKSAALYLELAKALIYFRLIREDISNQEKQLNEIRSLYRNGVVLRSDVLRSELELSKRRLIQVQIANDIRIASQKLNIIIGEPDMRPLLPLDGIAPGHAMVPSYEECLDQAFRHSFPYHISEQETELSKLNLLQIRANVRPKVTLYGDFYYANPQIFLYPYNPSWYSLGVAGIKASFPLSAIYHNRHKEHGSRLELQKEEIAHHDMEDQVRQEVNEAYLRYNEALVQVDVAKVDVEHAAENARILRDNYFKQTALITDLLDADIQVLQTRFELAGATLQAQVKYYLLQHIIGTL